MTLEESQLDWSVEMAEGGKEEEVMNEMFAWDSCSFSLWGAAGGGGRIEVIATEAVEKNGEEEERKKRKRSDELGKGVMDGGGDEEKCNGNGNGEEQVPEVHTQTERERRKRMRGMFGTLHGLVPHLTSKADKATIVEETVKYIRTLEQTLQILQDKKREKLKESNNSIAFNPFAPSCSSFIPPQHHPSHCLKQQQMVPSDLISRASLLADHYHYYSSSSASITPTNSNPTTPRSNLTSPLGSPIMMINNNDIHISREPPVKLRLPPSSITFKTFTSENVVISVCGSEAQFCLCGARKPGFYTGICLVLEKFQLEAKTFQISSYERSNLTMVTILARATALLDRYPVEEIYKAAGFEMLTWVSS